MQRKTVFLLQDTKEQLDKLKNLFYTDVLIPSHKG